MLRRAILDQLPMSKLAQWSNRLGWFALTVTGLSIIVVRSGILEAAPALATFAAALGCSVLAILFGLASFIVIWRHGLKGLGQATNGTLLGLALLAYPVYLGYLGIQLPMINDITTDPDNPPHFDVLAHLRPRGTSNYPGTNVAALQHTAYPNILPLQLDVQPQTAYQIALTIVTKRNWHILDAQSPAPGRGGIIEAVARTPIMGRHTD
jgi:Protein of unknown function (DUF1499)